MDASNSLQSLQDLAFGPEAPLAGLAPHHVTRRRELLAPFLVDGLRLVVYAGEPVGVGHWRAGRCWPRVGREVELASQVADGDQLRIDRAALDEVLGDVGLLVMPKAG
jgi:hypothetical protein